MAYKNLGNFMETLERAGELTRIKEYVNPHLEITEITDRVSKHNGPALLFENTGYDFPVLINSMGSYKRMCMALGVNDMEEVGRRIGDILKMLTSPKENLIDKLKLLPKIKQMASWAPKTVRRRGECQEVVMEDPDITKFPVLKCWPEDGGPFITLPVVHTKDPVTGIRNVGMYRMQVFGPRLCGMHWHRHKVSARHFNEYKRLVKKMPVAVALGGDPAYTYAATAPLPDGVDEYMLAGFLRNKKVELVQCISQDVQVPADAEIIIEGYVDPGEDFILEGPFGDHTGYYSLPDYYPRFHITCITHRKQAVYPATIVGIPPQEDTWIGKATERIFLWPLKMTIAPEITDILLPIEGVFHNLAIIKINKTYPGQALKIMNALWGAGQMMFTKIMIITDNNTDTEDFINLAKCISDNINPTDDIYFFRGPADELDHTCSNPAFGGKMGIDATKKFPEEIITEKDITASSGIISTTELNTEEIIKSFPEISGINASLLKDGINLLLVSVRKERKGHLPELTEKLFARKDMKYIKAVIYMDKNIDLDNLGDLVWQFANNFDPGRDSFTVKNPDGELCHIGFDGCRKTKEFDNFKRAWPNILTSLTETIEKIDKIWPKLGLGNFIASPSMKYLKNVYSGGAAAD